MSWLHNQPVYSRFEWGRSGINVLLSLRIYQIKQFLWYALNADSCCGSWHLKLNAIGLYRGTTWIYNFPFHSESNCTIKGCILEEKRHILDLRNAACLSESMREEKLKLHTTNTNSWAHWIRLKHPQILILSLQPFYEAKNSYTKVEVYREWVLVADRNYLTTKGNSITWLNA